jgi:hypothetical protein
MHIWIIKEKKKNKTKQNKKIMSSKIFNVGKYL